MPGEGQVDELGVELVRERHRQERRPSQLGRIGAVDGIVLVELLRYGESARDRM